MTTPQYFLAAQSFTCHRDHQMDRHYFKIVVTHKLEIFKNIEHFLPILKVILYERDRH